MRVLGEIGERIGVARGHTSLSCDVWVGTCSRDFDGDVLLPWCPKTPFPSEGDPVSVNRLGYVVPYIDIPGVYHASPEVEAARLDGGCGPGFYQLLFDCPSCGQSMAVQAFADNTCRDTVSSAVLCACGRRSGTLYRWRGSMLYWCVIGWSRRETAARGVFGNDNRLAVIEDGSEAPPEWDPVCPLCDGGLCYRSTTKQWECLSMECSMLGPFNDPSGEKIRKLVRRDEG
jgi:hypothetical protein